MSHIHLIKQSKFLIIFGCVFYLAFLAECGLAGLIKYIAKAMHTCMGKETFRNMLIQIYTNSLKNYFSQNIVDAKYNALTIFWQNQPLVLAGGHLYVPHAHISTGFP